MTETPEERRRRLGLSSPTSSTPSSEHSTSSSSSSSSNRRDIIGGYFRQPTNQSGPPIGGLSPASAQFANPVQTFDPYRNGDLRRILGNQVQAGSLADLQQTLIQVGLLDADEVLFGYADDGTADAMTTLLGIANQQGMDWRDVLSTATQAGDDALAGVGPGGSGGGRQLAPDIIRLPNRDDVMALAEDAGMALSGQRPDDDLQASMADSILDVLRTQQERQYQAEIGMTEGLHFTEGAPDPQRLVEEEIRRREPDKVMGRGVQDAMNSWFAALAGPV